MAISQFVQTSNATPTVAVSQPFSEGDIFLAEARIVAKSLTGFTVRAAFSRKVLAHCTSGTITLDEPVHDAYTYKSNENLDCTISSSNNELQVVVTGLADTDIKWIVNLDQVLVS
jgi:hypothetical protein